MGDDINGTALLTELRGDGVDTRWCARYNPDPNPNPLTPTYPYPQSYPYPQPLTRCARAGRGHATPTSFILVRAATATPNLTPTLP